MKLFDIKWEKKPPFFHITLDSLYRILMQFMSIGILGFIMESTLEYIFQGYFRDRGFLCGPFIPIYGIAVLFICFINIFPKMNLKNFFITFLISFISITLFEEFTGQFCERVFNVSLWSYAEYPCSSYTGYTNLFISLLWGICSTLYLIYVIPFFDNFYKKFNKRMRITISSLFLILFITDIIITFVLFNINNGYKEIISSHKRNIEYTLFLLGTVLYFVLTISLFRYISKKIILLNEKLDFLCFIISFILITLPIFSAFEYLERTRIPFIQGLAVLGFIDCAFLIYLLLSIILLTNIYLLYKLIIKNKEDKISEKFYFYKKKSFKSILILISFSISILVCTIGVINVKNPKTVKLEYGSGDNKLKIVAISDLHYETTGCIINLDDFVKDINKENPDVVFLLGDIVDTDVSLVQTNIFADSLNNIKSTYGIYLIPGNHEYESNKFDYVRVHNWFYNLENICPNFHFLVNKEVVIDNKVRVIGRMDYVYGGKSDNRTSLEYIDSSSNLTDKEKELPLIVLDHQPQGYKDSLNFGAKLQLSGHTHDAQLFPGNWILDVLYKVKWNCIVEGNFNKNDFNLYITKGYGTWGFPMRTTGRSELLSIDFKY